MWVQEHCQDSQDTRWISCVARLSWHDNRWWSTSYSLESRPLKSLTSWLFVDRDDEEEPRAIRKRWSVFINSVLENFPPGAEDRPTSGWEKNRGGSSWWGKMKERNGRMRESSVCSKSRPDAHANLYPGVEPPREGTCNLRGAVMRSENSVLERSNFAMGSALCSGD